MHWMGGGVNLHSGSGRLEYSKPCHFYFFWIVFKYIINISGSNCLPHKELFSWSTSSKTQTERTLLWLLDPWRRAQWFVPQTANNTLPNILKERTFCTAAEAWNHASVCIMFNEYIFHNVFNCIIWLLCIFT